MSMIHFSIFIQYSNLLHASFLRKHLLKVKIKQSDTLYEYKDLDREV